MPGPALSRVLADVRERIARAGSRGLNERNTEVTLIEPVMKALGWELEDVDEVVREYKLKPRDRPVDYGLMIHREPRLLIEAKGLGESLTDHRWARQILTYASEIGVQWIVLTDGDEYRIYNAAAVVPAEQKLFRTVRVTDNAADIEETLLLLSKSELAQNRIDTLWKAVHVDRRVQRAIESLFSPDGELALVNLVHARTKDLSPDEVRASLRRCRIQLDFPAKIDELEAVGAVPEKEPRQRSDAVKEVSSVTLGDLIAAGLVRLPMDIEVTFKKTRLVGRIEGPETVSFLGKVYPSLSAAGGAARAHVLRVAKHPATNGWGFWKFRDGDGQPRVVSVLRERFLERRTSKGRARGVAQ